MEKHIYEINIILAKDFVPCNMLRDEQIDVIYEDIDYDLEWNKMNIGYGLEDVEPSWGYVCDKYKVEFMYSVYSEILWDLIIDGYTKKNLTIIKNGESYRLAAEAFIIDINFDKTPIEKIVKTICCFDIKELDRSIGIKFNDFYIDNTMRFVHDNMTGAYISDNDACKRNNGSNALVLQDIELYIKDGELFLNIKFDFEDCKTYIEKQKYNCEKNVDVLIDYFYYKNENCSVDVIENDDELPF